MATDGSPTTTTTTSFAEMLEKLIADGQMTKDSADAVSKANAERKRANAEANAEVKRCKDIERRAAYNATRAIENKKKQRYENISKHNARLEQHTDDLKAKGWKKRRGEGGKENLARKERKKRRKLRPISIQEGAQTIGVLDLENARMGGQFENCADDSFYQACALAFLTSTYLHVSVHEGGF
jgi:hypothetical protein